MRQRKYFYLALTVVVLLSVILVMNLFLHYSWAEPQRQVQVALLAGEICTEQDQEILSVYEQILKEEGFSYRVVSPAELAGYVPGQLQGRYQAIVAPEKINAGMTEETAAIIDSYVRDQGGSVLFSLDPATALTGGAGQPLPLLVDRWVKI